MSDNGNQAPTRDAHFENVLAVILEEEEAGNPIDLSRVVRENPELETRLREFFCDRDAFDRVAHKLAPTAKHSEVPQSLELAPGSRFDGYEVLQEVDHGGRGVIYQVTDSELHRPLAVKVLRPELQGEPDAVHRFLEEAQVTGQLQHPGIVPVHAVGTLPDSRPYFAMKLIQGRTLAKLLTERSTPSNDLPRFLGIFEQVCQALAYAHSRGVIHRDLKPANIMVGAFAEVQVMDWGMAKVRSGDGAGRDSVSAGASESAADSSDTIRTIRTEDTGLSSADGLVVGTIRYMSPEQAKGEVEKLDSRTDVFGLGAVLCEILTGLPPYTPETRWDLQQKAVVGDVADAFARLDGSGADAELITLAKECLASERERRPRDAGAVAGRLATYLTGVRERLRQAELERAAAEARTEEARAKVRAERRARRLILALAASALAVVLLSGGWAWWYQRDKFTREVERATRKSVTEATVTTALVEVEARLAEAREQTNDPRLQLARLRLALSAVKRAEEQLTVGEASEELMERVRQNRTLVDDELQDSELLVELDRIRLDMATATSTKGHFDRARAIPQYAAALRRYGVEVSAPAKAGARVGGSRLRDVLMTVLEDWARMTTNEEEIKQLVAVRRAAMPEPDAFLARWWTAGRTKDTAELVKLAAQPEVLHMSAPTLVSLATGLEHMHEFEAAEGLLRKAQQRFPGDFWINHNLGMLLHNHVPERAGEAARFLTAALALRNDSAGIHNNMGAVLSAGGDLDGAIRHFLIAIELDPSNSVAHSNLGKVLVDKRELEEAIRHCKLAIERDPEFAPAHCNLGNALKKKGDLVGAIHELQTAVDLDPKKATFQSDLGVALEASDDRVGAIRCYRAAIEIDPNNATAHTNLGILLFQKEDRDKGIDHLRAALKIEPKNSAFHNNMANALAGQKDFEAALLHYRIAIVLDPKNASAHYNLAVALGRKGDFAAAVHSYAAAFAADPKIVEDPRSGARYGAAQSAALAAAGKSEDSSRLDDKERARLRKQALDWLRADLKAINKLADDGPPQTRHFVARALQQWQQTSNLAGLREKDAVAKLPEGEHEEWLKLWADVEALRNRASETK
jgi:serine/threonine-protein kinase